MEAPDEKTNPPDGNVKFTTTDVNAFNPPLYLSCGPLLRFSGLTHGHWRGSILIVTDDAKSSYTTTPEVTLSKTTKLVRELKKLSRTGKPFAIKPTNEILRGMDYSRHEGGLFQVLQTYEKHPHEEQQGQENEEYISKTTARQIHAERGVTFWRFDLSIPQSTTQIQICYRINKSPCPQYFWIPGRAQNMHVMFHSCNGFSLGVDTGVYSGPDPLWRDVLRTHTAPAPASDANNENPNTTTNDTVNTQGKPFNLMLGGGDQLYTDESRLSSPHFSRWTETTSLLKLKAPFTPEMRDELQSFFLQRYLWWFSQGLFSVAAAHIPMVNLWDDHDIIDGYGSYPGRTMEGSVFRGLGGVAWEGYMLFQHHVSPSCINAEGSNSGGNDDGTGNADANAAGTGADDESWIIGPSPGPYITQHSRSVFMHLGPDMAFLGLDCRTERTRSQILTPETYTLVYERLRRELRPETKHLLILLGVPIIYPRLSILETLFSSRLMTPLKAIGRAGLLSSSLFNKFDGGVEILDDLEDHWTTRRHLRERQSFIEGMQQIAAERGVRVTFLSGDVHLGAVGEFFTVAAGRRRRVRFWKRREEPAGEGEKRRDVRYMVNVISSAIANRPPAAKVADILNRCDGGRTHYVNKVTGEKMVGLFGVDVDGRERNNRHLLPRRNWCEIATGTGHATGESRDGKDEGLDVQLHFERETGDPAGWTRGYSLHVPGLDIS